MVSINFDISLLIQIVNFLFLMLALNYLLYKPIRKILADRKSFFDNLKDNAASAKALLESGETEKARLAAESLRLALDVKNDLRNQGLVKEKDILSEAQAKAAENLEAARHKLQNDAETARTSLFNETKIIAWDMAGKILGRSL